MFKVALWIVSVSVTIHGRKRCWQPLPQRTGSVMVEIWLHHDLTF